MRHTKCINAHACCLAIRPTLRDAVDCHQPGCSVHGIFLARTLVGLPFPTPKCINKNLQIVE